MKRGLATLLALSAMVLTPTVAVAGPKTPAEQGAEDKAAAEKAKADKVSEKLAAEKPNLDKLIKADAAATTAATPPAAESAHAPAADSPPAPPAPAAEKAPAEPLNLRPAHAIEPAASSSGLGLGAKLSLAALIGGAAFFVYRRRSMAKPAKLASLRVTARASIGARTEVCIVEVDGQRLLLGVTPSSIRTLTVLTEEAIVEQEATTSPVEEGLARLFASARRDALADVEPNEAPATQRLAVVPESRPVTSLRSGRSAALPESGRATVVSPGARSDTPKAATPRKTAARRGAALVEGQVSGLLTMRSGRS